MEIEIAKLASLIVGTILVPFLKQGAEKFSEQMGAEAGEETASLAAKVWAKVKAAFGSGKDKERIETFAKKPEDKKSFIIELLEEKLGEDSQLAQELYELVYKTETSNGKNVLQIIADKVGYVDARYSTISGDAIVAGYIGSVGPQPSRRPNPPSPSPGEKDENA